MFHHGLLKSERHRHLIVNRTPILVYFSAGFTILLEISLPSGEACNFFCKIKKLFNPSNSSATERTSLLNSTNNSTQTTPLGNSNSLNSSLMDLGNSTSGFVLWFF